MPGKISSCPNCGADKGDISSFASYFDVYECESCGEKYCHHCHGSGTGARCPSCGSKDRTVIGRVSA